MKVASSCSWGIKISFVVMSIGRFCNLVVSDWAFCHVCNRSHFAILSHFVFARLSPVLIAVCSLQFAVCRNYALADDLCVVAWVSKLFLESLRPEFCSQSVISSYFVNFFYIFYINVIYSISSMLSSRRLPIYPHECLPLNRASLGTFFQQTLRRPS